ncbi:proton-coupled amino acid transporter-like protein CG1139 isoform X2 [Anabrus simplex]
MKKSPLDMNGTEKDIPDASPLETFSSTVQLTENQRNEKEGLENGSGQPDKKKTSDGGALAHILKSSLGSGILAMPHAFKNGGLVFGLVATLIVGYICTHTVHILVKSSQVLSNRVKATSLDFAETAEKAFETGPVALRPYAHKAKLFVNVALIATYYSVSCVYVVFIAQSAQQLVFSYLPEYKDVDLRVYMAILLVPLLVLSLPSNLKFLVPFSTVANFMIVGSFVVVLYFVFTDLPSPSERTYMAPVEKLPLFFSTVIFAMEGIGMVLPVANDMRNPGHFLSCPGVLNIAMMIVVGLYAVIGSCGYVKYGEETAGSVTLNLPGKSILANIAKTLIPLAMLLTYGLLLYVPNDIIFRAVLDKFTPFWKISFKYGLKIVVVLLSVMVAALVPNLGPIISLVGAVCVSTLGLLCPAVIETVVLWDGGLGWGKWRLYKNVIIAALSLFALVTGSYTSVLEIVYISGEVPHITNSTMSPS